MKEKEAAFMKGTKKIATGMEEQGIEMLQLQIGQVGEDEEVKEEGEAGAGEAKGINQAPFS